MYTLYLELTGENKIDASSAFISGDGADCIRVENLYMSSSGSLSLIAGNGGGEISQGAAGYDSGDALVADSVEISGL